MIRGDDSRMVTIFAERENFRAVFHDFDFGRVARSPCGMASGCSKDVGIVRHRGEVEVVVSGCSTR